MNWINPYPGIHMPLIDGTTVDILAHPNDEAEFTEHLRVLMAIPDIGPDTLTTHIQTQWIERQSGKFSYTVFVPEDVKRKGNLADLIRNAKRAASVYA